MRLTCTPKLIASPIAIAMPNSNRLYNLREGIIIGFKSYKAHRVIRNGVREIRISAIVSTEQQRSRRREEIIVS
jgi:hypothetical protein